MDYGRNKKIHGFSKKSHNCNPCAQHSNTCPRGLKLKRERGTPHRFPPHPPFLAIYGGCGQQNLWAITKKETPSFWMVFLFWRYAGRGLKGHERSEKTCRWHVLVPVRVAARLRRERAEPRKKGLHRQRVKKNNCVLLGCALVASAVRRPHSCPPNEALP